MGLSRVKSCMILIGVLGVLVGPLAASLKPPSFVVLDSLASSMSRCSSTMGAYRSGEGKCAKCIITHRGGTLEPSCLQCHKALGCASMLPDCHSSKRLRPTTWPFSTVTAALSSRQAGLKGAYHRNCLGCHTENAVRRLPGLSPPQRHGDALFRPISCPAAGRKVAAIDGLNSDHRA